MSKEVELKGAGSVWWSALEKQIAKRVERVAVLDVRIVEAIEVDKQSNK